jgi:hypothetical protein
MYSKTIKLFFLGAIFGLAVGSCNKIKEPYAASSPSGTDTAIVKTRKILIEEFTGHSCVNCPKGALTIHSLQDEFPGKIISVAYHSGLFAKPQPSPSVYTQDFRTPVGDAYTASVFHIVAYPTAMVNRENFLSGNHKIEDSDKWRDTVLAYKDKAPDAFLTITNSYSSPSLTTTIKCEFLNMMTGSYNLVVFLTEDSIVAPQKNGTTAGPSDPAYPNPDADSYVHKHMMRDCISDPAGAGVQIVNGSVAAGDSVIKTFNYTLPANFNGAPPLGTIPVEKHCNVVAFIYNTTTQEVVQAEEQKMK